MNKTFMRRLRREINDYKHTAIADSWKGTAHPDDHEALALLHDKSKRKLHATLHRLEQELHHASDRRKG